MNKIVNTDVQIGYIPPSGIGRRKKEKNMRLFLAVLFCACFAVGCKCSDTSVKDAGTDATTDSAIQDASGDSGIDASMDACLDAGADSSSTDSSLAYD